MHYFVTVDGEEFEVEREGGRLLVNGDPVEADLQSLPGSPVWSLLLDGRSHALLARRRGGGEWDLDVADGPVRVEVLDRAGRAIRELERKVSAERGPQPLRAPMPGMVVKVDVVEGEEVGAGQAIVVVEAMKMENELRSPSPGVVRKLRVEAGQTVEKDQVLVELGPVGGGEEQDDG